MQTFARKVVILALVTGSFGLGASEFLVMALLPEIASDIARDMPADQAEALASTLASGYAIGVAVGVFVVPRLLHRFTDARTLLICAVLMLAFTIVIAVSPTLVIALPARFLSALLHATYVGTASVVVSRMLGRDGIGSAVVIGGLTVANVTAVPALTALGAFVSWRIGLVFAAVLFLPAAVVACCATKMIGADHAVRTHDASSPRRLSRGTIALPLVVTLLATGVCITMSFIAPLARELQGGNYVIPMFVTMAAFGVGMNLGNFISGWQSDHHARRALWLWVAVGVTGCGVLHFEDISGVTTLMGALLIGAGFGGITPPAQVLMMRSMAHNRRLAASLAPAIVNLGIFGGTSIAGLSILIVEIIWLPMLSLLVTALGIALAVASRRALMQHEVRF